MPRADVNMLMVQWGDKPKLMFFMLNGIKTSQ